MWLFSAVNPFISPDLSSKFFFSEFTIKTNPFRGGKSHFGDVVEKEGHSMKAEKKVMCSSQDEVFMSHDLDLQEL